MSNTSRHHRTDKMTALLIKLGVKAPATAFNQRADRYAREAERAAQTREAQARHLAKKKEMQK